MLNKIYCWIVGHKYTGWFDTYDEKGRVCQVRRMVSNCSRCGAKLK